MAAYQKGLRVRWWDFFFYAVFGLVVTSFVRIAGVLLVFSYLIVPAVCGINLAQRMSNRLLIGWFIALVGGVAGLFLSYWWDLPSGAAIVCTLVRCSFSFLFWRFAATDSIGWTTHHDCVGCLAAQHTHDISRLGGKDKARAVLAKCTERIAGLEWSCAYFRVWRGTIPRAFSIAAGS